jgi:hypothetical protein
MKARKDRNAAYCLRFCGGGGAAAQRRQRGGSVWDRQPWWTISRHLEQIGKGRAVSTAHRPRSSFRHTPQRNGSVGVNIGAMLSGTNQMTNNT